MTSTSGKKLYFEWVWHPRDWAFGFCRFAGSLYFFFGPLGIAWEG